MKIDPTPVVWNLVFDKKLKLNIYIEVRHQRNSQIKYSVIADENYFLNKETLTFMIDPNDHLDQKQFDNTRLNSFEECILLFEQYLFSQEKLKSPEPRFRAIQKHYRELSQIENKKPLV